MRPNRPHIPSFYINVKERGHKTDSTPELRAYLPSRLQISSRVLGAASLRRFVFGEALFTDARQSLQEEKRRKLHFFVTGQGLQGFFVVPACGMGRGQSLLPGQICG